MLGEPERAFADDRLEDARGPRRVGELAPETRLGICIDRPSGETVPRHRPGALRVEIFLRQSHQFDHPLVGLAGRLAEGKNAVIEKDHADRLGASLPLELLRAELREIESRYEIGDHRAALSVYLADALVSVPGIAHRKHGVGMRMVHEFR